MTPLFIPLKTKYFNAFTNGSKTEELRAYGPRWDTATCQVGRRVTLSCGYGKAKRLAGTIWRFKKQHGSTFGRTYKADILSVYGTLDIDIACISIKLSPTPQGATPMTALELKTARSKHGLTQVVLARILQVATNTVYCWESGRRTIPKWVPMVLALTKIIKPEKKALPAS